MIKQLKARIDGSGMDNAEIINTILENRGIYDVAAFLKPKVDDLVPFEEMIGLEEAHTIIEDAITMGEKFLVLADVDVDGASAGAIMTRYLRARGANVKCVINQGKEHGAEHFDLKLLDDISVMIIVDSINNDPEVYRKITETGTKLCVFDHHIPEKKLLESDVPFILVSSANYYPNKELSGAGVALKYVLFADYSNLTSYADDLGLWLYGALGLVADMCSMETSENRYIVYKGLSYYKNPMIKRVVGNYAFDSTSISFSIAPLVNAGMRVNQNKLAVDLFLEDDEDEITEIVNSLKQCRELQNEIVDSLMKDLLPQASQQEDNKCMFFMLPSDIDAEVTGLIANKLLAIYQRPLFVLRDRVEVDNETGEIIKHEYSGSMRAIGTSSFKEYVESTGYGWIAGHENAAGFGVDVNEFEDFKVAIEDALKDVEFSICVEADIELEPNQINDALIKQLVAFNRISGADCPPIKVLVRTNDYEVSTFSTKKHLKIIDNETGLLIVKWNCSDWETMDNDGEIVAVGTLSSPVYGRKHFTQLTIDEYIQQK